MVKKTYCDVCAMEITNQNSPMISLAVQSPAPSTSPDLCSYDCAIAWLTARKAKDGLN